MRNTTFGFVGLGKMGRPMAGRVLDAGRSLAVHDIAPDAVAALASRGARVAPSLRALADEAETIYLSLPNPQAVHDVLLGEGGIAAGTAVRRVIDLSTIGPRMAVQVASALSARGIVYADAPVSGGVAGAAGGTLAVMVSCPDADYEEVHEALRIFGRIFRAGDGPGQAQTLKLANNLLSVGALALTSEVMVMGVKAGLSPHVMLEAINAGSGRNSATQDKFPRSVLPGSFAFGFESGLAYKDVRLCIDEAETLGVPMVVGAAVREMMAVTTAMFGGGSDFTSVCRVVENWGHAEVRG